MTTTQTLQDILRPYAASDDLRFEAIRCKHPNLRLVLDAGYWNCWDCQDTNVRTDLSALMDMAEACGFPDVWFARNGKAWIATVSSWDNGPIDEHAAEGATRIDALAHAFVAAVPLP